MLYGISYFLDISYIILGPQTYLDLHRALYSATAMWLSSWFSGTCRRIISISVMFIYMIRHKETHLLNLM